MHAGGGIYYYWQAGAAIYLQERFDLEKAKFAGASAGALTTVIQACDADFIAATERAVQISAQERVWDRPTGLFGVWGPLVRRWLDDVVPENAAKLCDGRVSIAVTSLPLFRTELISSFATREDVIETCLASVHIPFFMDGKPAKVLKGRPVLDGSFWYFATKQRSAVAVPDGMHEIVYFDYGDDEKFMKKTSGNFLQLATPEGVWEMMQYGYEYVERIDGTSALAALSPYRRRFPLEGRKPILIRACASAGA